MYKAKKILSLNEKYSHAVYLEGADEVFAFCKNRRDAQKVCDALNRAEETAVTQQEEPTE